MEELKKLLEEMGKAFEEFKKANNDRLKAIEETGSEPAELKTKVDTINTDISRISAEIKAVELAAKENKAALIEANRPGAGIQIMSQDVLEHKSALELYLKKGEEPGLRDLERKAVNLGTDPEGGYWTSEEMSSRIGQLALDTVAMRNLAETITIGGLSWSEVEETSEMTMQWLGEKSAVVETTTPEIAEITIPAHIGAVSPRATQTSLDDSVIDIEQWLAKKAGRAFAKGEGVAFITGSGNGRPRGIAEYTTIVNASYVWGKIGHTVSGKSGAFADSTPSNALINLQTSLKPEYRNGASWLMNSTTESTIRQFVDGMGNYLWRPGLIENKPDTLFGKPVAIDDNVADLSSSSLSIFFANFREAYTIVDRAGVSVLRNPYSNPPYVSFYTTKRTGGGVRNFAAIKVMKFST